MILVDPAGAGGEGGGLLQVPDQKDTGRVVKIPESSLPRWSFQTAGRFLETTEAAASRADSHSPSKFQLAYLSDNIVNVGHVALIMMQTSNHYFSAQSASSPLQASSDGLSTVGWGFLLLFCFFLSLF